MSDLQNQVWQVSVRGNFEALKVWADAQDNRDDAPWLALSVFEEVLPGGRVQLIFEDQSTAQVFAQDNTLDAGFALDCNALENENWIAKSLQGLPVVRAGRFYVHGAHHQVPDDAALTSILIEAGEAFGTGHHGTTKGCMLALEDILGTILPAARILDLGTGAGTLAIAAAKVLPDADILATDIDPIAVKVAQDNAGINHVGNNIAFVVADGFDHGALKGKAFDLVFANILANPLIALADDITTALKPSAILILSGILDHQAARVRAAYEGYSVEYIREYALGEWRALVMKAPV